MPGEGYHSHGIRGNGSGEDVLCSGAYGGCGQQDHDPGGGQQKRSKAHYVQGGGLPADRQHVRNLSIKYVSP